jgi:hypothetical protein
LGYSTERKAALRKRLLPANIMTIRQPSHEEGIFEATLHKWRAEAALVALWAQVHQL